MATDLYIKLPHDFEGRYNNYKASILNIQKTNNIETQLEDKRPYCVVDGNYGFLKFNKQDNGTKIGKITSQPFRLLQCLTEPFRIAKTVDTVFEAIRENVKYKSKSGVYTQNIDKAKKVILIKYAIKEVQKIRKLQGKIKFMWDNLKTKVWLEYLGSNQE